MSYGEAFRLGTAGGGAGGEGGPDRGAGRRDWAVLAGLVVLCAAAAALGAVMGIGVGGEATLEEPPVVTGPWSFAWAEGTAPPSREQAYQVDALRKVTAGTAGLAGLLAAMIGVGLWRQRLRLRRHENQVHWAVGANSRHFAARAAGEGRSWLSVAAGASVVVALGLPSAIERSWPGPAEVAPPLAAALLAATVLVALVFRWEAKSGRGGRLGWMSALVSSPTAVATVGFTVLSAVTVLSRHVPGAGEAAGPEGSALADSRMVAEVSLAGLSESQREDAVVRWIRARRTPFGVASAGAVRGAGHRAGVWVDCGQCFEGGLPMPIKVVQAEVHAVAPDTFPFLGVSVLEGRDFDLEPGFPETPTAIVTRSMAVRHFQQGEAIGRRIRVGDSPWLEVVGVVDDPPEARNHFEYVVYLPLSIAAPTALEVIADGEPGSMRQARAIAPPGVVVGAARSVVELFGVHRWFARLSGVVGMITGLMVFLGVWVGGRNEAKAAAFELSVRRAVGARARDLRVHLMTAAIRRLAVIFLVGGWLSLFLGAGLNAAYGAIPQIDPEAWAISWTVVAVAFLMSRVPPYRATMRGSPAEGLRAR